MYHIIHCLFDTRIRSVHISHIISCSVMSCHLRDKRKISRYCSVLDFLDYEESKWVSIDVLVPNIRLLAGVRRPPLPDYLAGLHLVSLGLSAVYLPLADLVMLVQFSNQ